MLTADSDAGAGGESGEEEDPEASPSQEYKSMLQTDLPMSKQKKQIDVITLDEFAPPPCEGETEMDRELRHAAARKELERQAAEVQERHKAKAAAAERQRVAVFEAVRADDTAALAHAVATSGAEVLYLADKTGETPLEVAVALKRSGACALLVEVADDADAAAEAEAHLLGGGSLSPGGRKGLLGTRLKALRKAASQIGGFQPEVGMELRAKKRPLGHRNMNADAFYPCVVVGLNDDGSMRVRYPDEGRRGIEDEGLTIDLVDLASDPKKRALSVRTAGAAAPSAEDSMRSALADLF